MSKRTKKVSEAIKHDLGEIILKQLSDENLKFVSITRVAVSADLKIANIYFSTLRKSPEKVKNSLEKARGLLKAELVKKIRLKYTPDLIFYEDKGIEHSLKISKILNDLNKDNSDDKDIDGKNGLSDKDEEAFNE